MTDGQVVKLDNGAVAQLKRLVVPNAPHVAVLVAVELPAEPRPETDRAH